MSKKPQNLISKVAPRKALDQNSPAFEAFEQYKKTSDLINRAEIAMGRKSTFKYDIGSTTNFEIDQNVISSTTI